MPVRSRRNSGGDSSRGDETLSTEGPRDAAQDRIGNGGLFGWLAGLLGNEREAAREIEETPVLDAAVREEGTVDEAQVFAEADEVVRNKLERAGDVEEVTLREGGAYVVTAEDMSARDPWSKIARDHGMSGADLAAFNQHVVEVSEGVGPAVQFERETELAAGVEIYLPSAEELAFAECRRHAGSYEEAIDLYGKLTEGPNIRMVSAARDRASDVVGEAYGTGGVDGGWFHTPNETLNGAKPSRSMERNGRREYKVFWLADFWKCSVFMHDVVLQAGYRPHQTSNDHYLLAGRLHQSEHFVQVPADKAMPGDCFQRFGGTASDQSHNAILSSFVEIEDNGEQETWTFDIIGAETERAAESTRTHTVRKGTTEDVGSGNQIRFFRPTARK